MSHLVLYRSFRPKNFDEVIGQDHIVKTLKNQVINGSFGHAYLFCGTRGTGKTSCAKIFARAINCLDSKDGSPCGKCANCLSNQNAENLDIIEIDAASNNRVDEIRDLREKIGYLPSVNKYKVYIIDEVHMLTDSAFNALLKTLEEPPQHAVFILATTEPHKLPATILSRCMRFDFKLVNENDLINHLKNVFSKSDIKFDEESLKLIAMSGNGSVRDTLSVAEMCSAYCNNNIKYELCLECLGITDSQTLIDIMSALADNNAKEILNITDNLKNQGKNFSVLINDLIRSVNNLLTIKLTQDAKELLKLPENIFDAYEKICQKLSVETMIDYLKNLTELDGKLKLSSNVELLVETTLLSMLYNTNQLEELKSRLDEIEKKTKNAVLTENGDFKKDAEVNTPIEREPKQEENKVLEEAIVIEEAKKEVSVAAENQTNSNLIDSNKLFGEIAVKIRKSNDMLLYSMLKDVKSTQIENDNLVLFVDELSADDIEKEKQTLNSFAKEYGLEVIIKKQVKEKENSVDEYLKQKFDNKITIIKE